MLGSGWKMSELSNQMQAPNLLTGVASKDRLLAAIADNLFSILGGIAVVAFYLKRESELVQGTVFVAVVLSYYFLGEAIFNATPGKVMFGLRVKQLSGRPITWSQALVRTVLRIVEVNPILLGALPAILVVWTTQRGQRLGDLLAGTVVVNST